MAPSDVIFVGDNETDVNCAVDAGIPTVVAIADGDKATRLAALGASHLRANLHAVSDLLLHSSEQEHNQI
jgi:phosphoglycolate phosphatase-like HAD superfamily hydrolase